MPCLRDSSSQWNCALEHDYLRNCYELSQALEPDVVVGMSYRELKNYKVVAHITNCLFFYAIKSKKDEPGDIA